MKLILILVIRVYWLLIPPSKRRNCLFKVSCSHYVYDKAKNKGLISGIKALIFRIKNCNQNHYIFEVNEQKFLITSDQKIFNETQLNGSILK